MKKSLFFSLCFFSLISQAQNRLNIMPPMYGVSNDPAIVDRFGWDSGAVFNGRYWWDYARVVYGYSEYYEKLDSLPMRSVVLYPVASRFIHNSTTDTVVFHKIGLCFDPTENKYGTWADPGAVMGKDIYYLDSVAFPYSYIRNVDSAWVGGLWKEVVDTLVFEFYKRVEKFSDDYLIYHPAYDGYLTPADSLNGLESNSVYRVKIPLHKSDTCSKTYSPVSFSLRNMLVPIPKPEGIVTPLSEIANGNVCAFSVHFKPMININASDTLDCFGCGGFTPKTNYVAMKVIANEWEDLRSMGSYNNTFAYTELNKDTLFSKDSLTFIPGWAFKHYIYLQGLFHTCTYTECETISIESLTVTGIKLFPNPSNGNVILEVPDNMNSQTISIKMTDQYGREVATKISKISERQIKIEFDALIKGGMFWISIQTEKGIFTEQIISR